MSGLLDAQSASRSIWNCVYTRARAGRGKPVYTDNCARCPGSALQGGDEIPTQEGARFMAKLDNATVANLINRMITALPRENPNRLHRTSTVKFVVF